MEENEDINTIHSSKFIMYFIVRLIMISVISYIYVVGMLKLTMISPGASPVIFGIKRGILIFLHIDLHFRIVRYFFQNTFPFNKRIGLIVAILSWAMGFILALSLNP
ncbi:hypothetical protein [Desulfosporosinus fructosivorans]